MVELKALSLALPLFAALSLAACAAAPSPVAAPPVASLSADAASALVNLAPPAPGEGVQLVAGPFYVGPGEEIQNNFFMKLPVDKDVMVDRIEIAYPPGSHHCNLFKSDSINVPDHVENTFSPMYPYYDMFANSQTGNLNWKLPEGVGMKFKGNQQLVIQTHYVNTLLQGTPGNTGLVKVNLHFAKPNAIKQTMGMLFAVNPSLKLLPHSTFVAQKDVSLSDQGFDKDVKIAAMSGHFHSRGRKFEVNRWTGRDPSKRDELIYESENWQEPPFKIYENGGIDFKVNQRLIYTGTFENNTDITIGFGAGSTDTKEHSNLFMYFYPGPEDGKAIYDVRSSAFQEVDEI